MENPKKRTLADLRWVALDGKWGKDEANGLVYSGNEYDPPPAKAAEQSVEKAETSDDEPPQKYVAYGNILFDQPFKEGRIHMQVEFDVVDHRSLAAIVIQYDTATRDMITFEICGGSLKFSPGVSGFLFRLRQWASPPDQLQGAAASAASSKVWTSLFQVGLGTNLMENRTYDLDAYVRGSIVTLYVEGVEIGKHTLSIPSLPGNPCGIFCGTHSKIYFRNISIEAVAPTAFVVMQFQPAEYEALFKEVIEPICKSQGLQAYRADSTYMPGLVIEDIKRQIAECRVVIAEITPTNPNVYYEVGYADALNKPLILIADRKEGLKPFDVRAYRTIFYENSIGGKNAVENDLRAYLKSIMNK